MRKQLNILILDDHPMIIEGYTRVLTSNKHYSLNIEIATNCDEALIAINKSASNKNFDIVFIDIQLPPSKDQLIISGEDISTVIKNKLPLAKIVILTMIDNPERMINIVKTTPHNGILIKSDITSKILLNAFDNILNNGLYYSKTVQEIINKKIANEDLLDEHNKKIIYYLSKGIKTKKLTDYIPLSLSAIEKRKSYIKQVLCVNGKDEELLIEAKKRGFI